MELYYTMHAWHDIDEEYHANQNQSSIWQLEPHGQEGNSIFLLEF
jgi:hypothetical protein